LEKNSGSATHWTGSGRVEQRSAKYADSENSKTS